MSSAVIFKFNDRFTSGIPDCAIVYDGVATWFELKVNYNAATRIQVETLRLLKRGYIVRWLGGEAFVSHVKEPVETQAQGPYSFRQLVEKIELICT